ncbi:transcriptional regulator [Halobacteriales archaeon QH_8_64_26]|jgi:DNA-binding Lrp family transcriptional regulator|nr:MAG: transcriptional regulator [Halobacteriales archaeon QH_8_64_26]
MVVAYVLVKANTGEADRLKRSISELGGIDRASIVAGDVDLIAKLSVDSPADVKEIAADTIQGIDGVESTQTYVAME